MHAKNKSFHAIPPKQIHILKEALNKGKMCTRLEIQNNPPHDPKRASKDAKIGGHKTDQQCITILGSRLVEYGQYAQLTEFFPSNPQYSQ